MTLGNAVQISIDSATAELRRELEETKRQLWGAERRVVNLETERDALKREVEELRNRVMWFDFTEALPRQFQLVFAEFKDGGVGKAIWTGDHWRAAQDGSNTGTVEVARWRNILDAEVAPSPSFSGATSERNE